MLDLELLVEALLVGRRREPLAAEDQLAAADLELELGGVDAGQVGAHDRPRRVADVVDVDGGEKPPRRRGASPRSKTSPNSSSISRRMRSKLAKRSRSGTPER